MNESTIRIVKIAPIILCRCDCQHTEVKLKPCFNSNRAIFVNDMYAPVIAY